MSVIKDESAIVAVRVSMMSRTMRAKRQRRHVQATAQRSPRNLRIEVIVIPTKTEIEYEAAIALIGQGRRRVENVEKGLGLAENDLDPLKTT